MKAGLVWSSLALVCAACLSGGTETGNPPTRSAGGGPSCSSCEPPITLEVTDAVYDLPVAGVRVDDDETACTLKDEFTWCVLRATTYATPERHALLVTAKGFEPAVIEVEIRTSDDPTCPTCSYVPVHAIVRLSPNSD